VWQEFKEFAMKGSAAASREGRQVAWSASEFAGFRHGYSSLRY
jgi:hypothetical protein